MLQKEFVQFSVKAMKLVVILCLTIVSKCRLIRHLSSV
jgi:hypothetical protein